MTVEERSRQDRSQIRLWNRTTVAKNGRETPVESISDQSEAVIITRERLRFLAVGYYVRGGVIIVFSSFLLFYVIMLSAFSFIPESKWNPSPTPTPSVSAFTLPTTTPHPSNSEAPPAIFFRIIAGVISGIMLLGWSFGALTLYAGRSIQKRKRKALIYVMAAFNCMFIPYGTLLGVFTFIILGSPPGIREFAEVNQPT